MAENIDCLNIFQQKNYTFIDFSQSMISTLSYQTFCRHNIQYIFANMFIPCCDLYAVRIGVCVYFCPIRCDLISVESFSRTVMRRARLLYNHPPYLDLLLTCPTYCFQAPFPYNQTLWLRILTFEYMECTTRQYIYISCYSFPIAYTIYTKSSSIFDLSISTALNVFNPFPSFQF